MNGDYLPVRPLHSSDHCGAIHLAADELREKRYAAALKILLDEGLVRLNSRAPYVQRCRVRLWLLRFRFRLETCRRGTVSHAAVTDKAAMFQLSQDIDELAASETAQQQAIIIAIRDRE